MWRVLLVLVLVGCQVKQELYWHLENTPQQGKFRLVFHLTYNGVDIKDPEVDIEANMNHAGMQPVFATAKQQWDGSYIATVDFNMAGDWILTATGTVQDKTLKGYYPVTVP